MTSSEKITFIQEQLAKQWQCGASVFSREDHTFLPSGSVFFEVVSFGRGAAFRMHQSMLVWAMETFEGINTSRIFDGPFLFQIEKKLQESGHHLSGEHLRYIYADEARSVREPADFSYALYRGEDVRKLYPNKNLQNALSYKQDAIALAAYHGDTLAGVAAADISLDGLHHIGIDVLAPYRERGLATYLVKRLSDAIVADGCLPYYTTWGGNIASTRVALACGYLPAWIGLMASQV